MAWLQSKIRYLNYYQEQLKSQEEESKDWPPNYICYDCGINCHQSLIEKNQNNIQLFQRDLQDGIEKEFNSVLEAQKEALKEKELDRQTRLGPGKAI